MSKDLPITIRPRIPGDVQLITSSWLHGMREEDTHKAISNPVYFWHQQKLIEHLWDKAVVLVCCQDTDPDQIYGWVCGAATNTHNLLHYVYVKGAFRRHRIATQLLNTLFASTDDLVYTHSTWQWRMKVAAGKGWTYNPYAAYYWTEPGWYLES